MLRHSRRSRIVPAGVVSTGVFCACWLAILIVTLAQPARAAWRKDGVPVSARPSALNLPRMAADDSGNVIVAWVDYAYANNATSDIYAQRLNSAGDAMWGEDGISICVAPGFQEPVEVVADGHGGAFVVWVDSRATRSVYAQHIDSTGAALWVHDGIPIAPDAPPAALVGGPADTPHVIPDGTGGIFVGWLSDLVRVQRVAADGTRLWGGTGVSMAGTVVPSTLQLSLVPGVPGELLVVRKSTQCCGGGVSRIEVAKWSPEGLPLWGALSTPFAIGAYDMVAVPDATGGVHIAWTSGSSVFALRIRGDQSGYWDAPHVVCDTTGARSILAAAPDTSGGAILAWSDQRYYPASYVAYIYVAKLDSLGVNTWLPNGLRVSDGVEDHAPTLNATKDGECFVVFNRSSRPWVARLASSGSVEWSRSAECPLSTESAGVTRGSNRVLIVPVGDRPRLYSVLTNGVAGYASSLVPRINSVTDVAGDEGGMCRIDVTCPAADSPGFSPMVTGYNLWLRTDESSSPAVGQMSGVLEALEAIRRGQSEGLVLGRGLATELGLPPGTWLSLGFHPAIQRSHLELAAPTLADSSELGSATQVYVVTTHTDDPSMFVASAPDSGHSVDNIPPGAPAPFRASYGATSTALHWSICRASDFVEYRLYKGTSPTFRPGPENLLGALRDTGFVDPGPSDAVYKLVSVDRHGNASTVLTVTRDTPVATLVAFVGANQTDRAIVTRWYSPASGASARVYRRMVGSSWEVLAEVFFDGRGQLEFSDESVETGGRYAYRVGTQDGGAEVFTEEVWLTAGELRLALLGVYPNPTRGPIVVRFAVPRAGIGAIQLLDVSGRVAGSVVTRPSGPGEYQCELQSNARLSAGLYFLKMTFEDFSSTQRVVMIP